MKILLCYSKDHFNPALPPSKHATWGISANILARELFSALSQIGEVTYSDGYDWEKHTGESYDLFVGIERNFSKILDVCHIGQSILIAVNMHPAERNEILNNFAHNILRDPGAISSGDLVNAAEIEESIRRTDFIFCFGNTKTLNSYIKNGVPLSKIKTFNYGLLGDLPKIKPSSAGTKNFLYPASAIGLRKGFDIVAGLCGSMAKEEFHIDIVGEPASEAYLSKVRQLAKRYPKNVTFHGYIPANSRAYRALFTSNDFLLFPSLEEGQAGTVIEAMYNGLIPIITAAAGTDFAPLGFLEPQMHSRNNVELLKKAVTLKQSRIKTLKHETQAYYQQAHTHLHTSLVEVIQNCLRGRIHPSISVVLPVYNKEQTIKPLLELLDEALNEYENADLHIILDGCTDNSEEVIAKFYRKSVKYKLKVSTTPNIFEVRSNNLGLLEATGKYAVILQDDNYIYDKYFLYEAVAFLDKNPIVAILGGLAGVNFYPIGTKNTGSGQIIASEAENYWRQDGNTNSEFKNQIFEVDACMRGPLFFRKSFLEDHGYLDEAFAPLYQDDMDICFRARKYGYKVYCMLMNVENRSLTMAHYDGPKAQHFAMIMKRNAEMFYKRWKPTVIKDYGWVWRIPLETPPPRTSHFYLFGGRLSKVLGFSPKTDRI